ncbi:MAG TPA: ABC transporter substrate-binding protein [Bacillota bacterium]|nr:ABC transporter substrate-binding protein [Bacillota bacterium]
MKKRTFGLLLLACLTTLSLGIWAQPQTKKVTVGMTYIPNVQFAPWYVAQEKGFFQEAGLEVNFDYRMDIDALQLVAAGQMDFAIAGGDQVITARSQMIPVVYLASLYAKFPPTIIAKAEAKITKPQDLKGKKLGLPLYGTNLLAAKAILKKAGVPESDVKFVDIGYTQIPSLAAGKVDAVVGFANNEPVKLRANGYRVTEIPAWNYVSLVGHGLITGEQQLKTAKPTVQKMVAATLKGMRYALSHRDETWNICQKYLPGLGNEQQKLEKEVLLTSMQLWENAYTRKKGLGQSNPKDWETSQQLMKELGLIKQTTPVNQLLNLSFIK